MTDTDTPGLMDMGQAVGQQGKMPGPLDGGGQSTLVPGTGAGLPPRLNSAPVGYIVTQFYRVFIIDYFRFVAAKEAAFTLRGKPCPAFSPMSGFI